MDTASFLALALLCAPGVHTATTRALVQVESSFNPWAIGVVGGALQRQPRHRAEALATAHALRAAGWDFSVGLGQINVRNFRWLGLSLDTAFEPCTNLAALQTVLTACLDRVHAQPSTGGAAVPASQTALRQALSCYYSGNFTTGIRHGYVQRVIAAAAPLAVPTVPPKEHP